MVDEGPTGIKAPDGGWGWAVLWGCFVITGFSYAFPKAVSVFFKELMREFGIGYSDTAWVSSILLAMLYGTGEGPSCPRDASESSPGSVLGKEARGSGVTWCLQPSPRGCPEGSPTRVPWSPRLPGALAKGLCLPSWAGSRRQSPQTPGSCHLRSSTGGEASHGRLSW